MRVNDWLEGQEGGGSGDGDIFSEREYLHRGSVFLAISSLQNFVTAYPARKTVVEKGKASENLRLFSVCPCPLRLYSTHM